MNHYKEELDRLKYQTDNVFGSMENRFVNIPTKWLIAILLLLVLANILAWRWLF